MNSQKVILTKKSTQSVMAISKVGFGLFSTTRSSFTTLCMSLYSSRRLRISIFVETHLNAIKNCIKLGLNSGNFEILKQNSYSSINGRVKSDFEIIQNDAIIAHKL